MKRLVALLASLLLVLSVACARPAVSPTDTAVKVSMVFHADTTFTEKERDDIAVVLDTWRVQTGGLADVSIFYDVDFESVLSLLEHAEHNVIKRIDSAHESVVDRRGDWAGILGWTAFNNHTAALSPVRMAIVHDKCSEAGIFRAVFMHEVGHALGMSHIPSRHALLYPAVKSDAACLTRADISEFCRVNDCGNTKMIPCERM